MLESFENCEKSTVQVLYNEVLVKKICQLICGAINPLRDWDT